MLKEKRIFAHDEGNDGKQLPAIGHTNHLGNPAGVPLKTDGHCPPLGWYLYSPKPYTLLHSPEPQRNRLR